MAKNKLMKSFLLNLFSTLDQWIFDYMVKQGFIKPFLGGLIGGRKARKAARKYAAQMQKIADNMRNPGQILGDMYGADGIYGERNINKMIGREKDMIPKFQELNKLRTQEAMFGEGGYFDVQEQVMGRQMDFVNQYGQQMRDAFEDPRMRQLSDVDMSEAMRLTREAQSPLSPESSRLATQTALGSSFMGGTIANNSAIAQAALGREDVRMQKTNQAFQARQFAGQSRQRSAIDPYQMAFGSPSMASQTSLAMIGSDPSTIVSDPGSAINLGMAQDQNYANLMMTKADINAKGEMAYAKGLGSSIDGLFNLFG